MGSATSNTLRRTIWRAFALFVLVVGILGIHRLFLRVTLPFEFRAIIGNVRATTDFESDVHALDIIRSIDGVKVNSESQVEFLLDGREIGDVVTISIFSEGAFKQIEISLIKSYPDYLFILVSLLIGLAFWGTAVFIMVKKPDERAPSVLFWALMLFALSIMTSLGNYSARPLFIGYLIRVVHEISYILAVPAFIHFTLIFPQQKWRRQGLILFVLYLLAVVIGIMLAVTQAVAIATKSPEGLTAYDSWRFGLNLYLVGGISGGLLILLHSSFKLANDYERKKVQWILWGTAVGVSPFLLLRALPELFLKPGFIKEEFALLFLLIIPVSFGIAVVKHHVFDIEVIIRRSIAYALLSGVVVAFYFAIVFIATLAFRGIVGESEHLVSLLAAFGIAILFNPVRHRIQDLVDRTFYRVHYDFKEAVRSLNAEIKESISLSQLAEVVIRRLNDLIPVERIALIVVSEPGHRMKVVAHQGFDLAAKHIPSLRVNQITTDMKRPVARPEKVEPGVLIDTGMVDVFERWGISLAFPLTLLPGQIVGVIVLGDKRSGARYSASDVDLLVTIASQVALAVERLQLQEQLIVGEMEKRRLEELNALKSEFVSSVSHELRTPLTSIQMFAETLRTRNVKSQKKRDEYLRIIQGESERLTRLINNILDFAKIEKGVKQYTLAPTNIKDILLEVLKSMEYQFEKMKFRVNARIPKRVPLIHADRDAVAEAVINLLSNAMKYSEKRRMIDIRLRRSGERLAIEVKDRGIGIPERELPNIFEKFYRVREGVASHAAGAGLGLGLVKHIMDAHRGEVRVQSAVGKGSTFTLLFPMKRIQP